MIPLDLTADREGERLDAFLARSVPDLTRSAAQRLLERGAVTLRGRAAKKNDKTRLGDTLTVCLPEPQPVDLVPQDIPLDVIYEDDDVIVVNKPVGLVVHPAPGHPDGTLVNALLYHCGTSLSGINGELRPGIVHRKKMAVDRKNGREAVTHWSVLARYPGYTHVECRLETGRTHQIRVHLASIGHPLLGDTVYGSKKPWPGLAGQCLHARRLRFVHPSTGEPLELECPLPDWFRDVLEKLEH